MTLKLKVVNSVKIEKKKLFTNEKLEVAIGIAWISQNGVANLTQSKSHRRS